MSEESLDISQETMSVEDTIVEDLNELPGVDQKLVDSWKKTYGTIFRVFWIDEQYVYRPITYTEYKPLRKRIREEFKDNIELGEELFKEEIQKLCMLWPADYKSRLETGKPKALPAGLPILLGDYILAASGFADNVIPDVIGQNGIR